YFSSINGVARNAIAKIRADGTVDPAWNTHFNGHVHAIVPDGAGNVYVAYETFVYKLNAQTGPLVFQAVSNNTGYALAIAPDGSIFVGGSFSTFGFTARSHLAKISPVNGALDTTWNVATDGTVYALAAPADGNLYVGGQFTTVGGAARKSLARVGT